MKTLLSGTVAVLSAGCFMAPGAAIAQDTSSQSAEGRQAPLSEQGDETGSGRGLDEIVVTAQRRSENLQKVPISIAVATASQLRSAGVNDVQNLKIATPGLEVGTGNAYAIPVIRGVGAKVGAPGVEAPIATYVDGVYYASTTATTLSFNNIRQIEVLKGPQGTLFGRNATGGLIQVITRDPEPIFGLEGDVGIDNYETVRANMYATGRLAGDLSADIALQGIFQGEGYGRNVTLNKDIYKIDHDVSVRSKLFWDGDRTDVRLSFDYNNHNGSRNAQRVAVGTTSPPRFRNPLVTRPWDAELDIQPYLKLKTGGVSLKANHDLDFADLVSITAYRKTKYDIIFDGDYTSTAGRYATIDQDDKQFSQELQLISSSDSRVTWVLGAYYFVAQSRYNPFAIFDAARDIDGRYTRTFVNSQQNTNSISGFGQITAALTDQLRVTGGLRYTSEKRELKDARLTRILPTGVVLDLTPPALPANTFKKLTWRAAIDYQLTPEALLYVSHNRGFKSGGFNPSSLTLPPFKPEVLDAYEGGLKSSLFDRRLRANVAGFFYNYKNVQVQRVVDGATGVFNGARAEIYGFDVDLDLKATDSLTLKAGYQYLHGRYKKFEGSLIASPNPVGGYAIAFGDVSDNHTILSPKHTFTLSADYRIELAKGDLQLNGSYYYNDGFFQEPDNLLTQPSYSLVNLSATYHAPDDRFWVSAWGKNLGNKAVFGFLGVNNTGVGGVARAGYEPPRTYGLTVGTKI